MHVIVTGYCDPKKQNTQHKFADFRLVAIQDTDDNPQDPSGSGNTEALVNSLYRLFTERCQDVIQEYNIHQNNIKVEKISAKGSAALRISVPFVEAENFLHNPFWKDAFGRLLAKKCYKDAQGNKEYITIPFNFDPDGLLTQINTNVTMDDYNVASKLTDDFIAQLFHKLDKPEVQAFLRNFCGKIKIVDVTGKGWELVQLSERNSIMVYAQYHAKGIEPKFVCNARDWARYFNRKLIPNAIGAIIEVPINNKRLDTAKYNQITGNDYYTDLNNGGASGYRANWIGNNQEDDATQGFYPGIVYDESQTEIMTDDNGNPLPDVFHDSTQQRRKTNLGNDTTLEYDNDVKSTPNKNDIANGVASPFEENIGKIEECLNNIARSIGFKRFINKKTNVGKYDNAKSQLETALKTHTVQDMKNVIDALAECELYQIENTKITNKKDQYKTIITNVIMSNCGFGDTYQLADYARKVLAADRNLIEKDLYDAIRNITNLINGSLLMKEKKNINETLCKMISFDEFLNIIGTNEEELSNKNTTLNENTNKVKYNFNNMLNRMNKL